MMGIADLLDQWAGRWLGAVATTAWQGGILIALVFLITKVLRGRLTPTVRHLLWVVVLLKFCAAPFVSVGIPVLVPPAPAPVVHEPASVAPWVEPALPALRVPPPEAVVARTDTPLPSASLPAPRRPLPLPRVLFLSWLAAVGVLLAGIVAKSLRVCRQLASADVLEDGPITEAVARAAARMGMRPPRVKTSIHITTPLVCGMLRPAVMIPGHIVGRLKPAEMEAVICHELAHIRRRDILTNWVQVTAQACWFFNPLVWYVNRQVRLEREQACDDWVLQVRRGEAKEYAEVLLKVVELCPKSMSLSLGIVGISEPFVLMAKRLGTVMDGGRRLSC